MHEISRYFIAFNANTQMGVWQLTVVLCRPHTSKVLCAGYDRTSQKFAWPAREEGADPLFYKQLSEHYRPDQQRNGDQMLSFNHNELY